MNIDERIAKKMRRVSSLITDMTISGATEEELTRAMEYAKTVIDSPMTGIDIHEYAKRYGIAALEAKYTTVSG